VEAHKTTIHKFLLW